MQVLTFSEFRKDNIYFRTIEEREKINEVSTKQAYRIFLYRGKMHFPEEVPYHHMSSVARTRLYSAIFRL